MLETGLVKRVSRQPGLELFGSYALTDDGRVRKPPSSAREIPNFSATRGGVRQGLVPRGWIVCSGAEGGMEEAA